MTHLVQLTANIEVSAALGDCPWMRFAIQELGQSEVAGSTRHNPRIMMYHAVTGVTDGDETAWCSSFANWCMRNAGFVGSGRPNARSWLQWGDWIARGTPVFGCVAIFSRPPQAWQGHVGFVVGETPGDLMLLGGNQSSPLALSGQVCVKPYAKSRLLGLRWPSGHTVSAKLRHLVADRATR